MTDSLKSRILEDVKDAMRARDKARLGTLRMVTAAIKQREVDQRIPLLDDTAVLAVLEKMLKQRRESASQYETAGRDDSGSHRALGNRDHRGRTCPQALAPEELDTMVAAAIDESGAATMKDMGRVMGLLKSRVQGRADMGAVSAAVKARLSG